MFDDYKHDMRNVGDDLDGTINRLGLICYRIAMVLTVSRFPNCKDEHSITCLDADFNNAVLLCQHLLAYNLYVYELLKPKATIAESGQFVKVDKKREEMIRECCNVYNSSNSLTYKEIALQVLGTVTGASTVYRWVKDYCAERRA